MIPSQDVFWWVWFLREYRGKVVSPDEHQAKKKKLMRFHWCLWVNELESSKNLFWSIRTSDPLGWHFFYLKMHLIRHMRFHDDITYTIHICHTYAYDVNASTVFQCSKWSGYAFNGKNPAKVADMVYGGPFSCQMSRSHRYVIFPSLLQSALFFVPW